MRIMLIWGADYPWDIRIEKFSRSLYLNGHEVHLLCRNLKRLPRSQVFEYGFIHRLPPFVTSLLNQGMSFPAFLNPIWLKAALNIINEKEIGLVIVRDLPLALSALFAGRITGTPVLMDMAENYVALLEDTWRYEPFRLGNILVRNPKFARLVEKLTVRSIDHILVVVEESRQRLLSEGVDASKIDLVSNTPDISFLENTSDELAEEEIRLLQDRYVIIYIGGLEYSRGLEQVVLSMVTVVKEVPESLLLVIGRGNSEGRLRNMARELGISNHVSLIGWVDLKRIPAFLKEASVGVIPHYVTNHTNNTIPNKLFDYMYYGLPVIASECRPIARILREENCGFIFSNTKQLAQRLVQLSNPALRKPLASRGKHAVKNHYNWTEDYRTLNRVVENLAQKS